MKKLSNFKKNTKGVSNVALIDLGIIKPTSQIPVDSWVENDDVMHLN